MQQLKNNIVFVDNAEKANQFKDDIIKIWEVCFGDSTQYIEMFLKHYLVEHCVLWIEDKKAVSMIFLLDCTLKTKDNSFIGKYVYAVATLPEHRKKGYTTKLLDFVNSTLIKNISYDFTVLVPSGKELFDFYRKRGYETKLFCEKGVLNKDIMPEIEYKIYDIDFIEYTKIRNEILDKNYIGWDSDFIKYCFTENNFFDGKQIKVYENKNLIAIAILAKNNDELIIKEIVFKQSVDNKEQVLQSLLYNYKCKKLQYKCNFNLLNKIPFGMIKWHKNHKNNISDIYIGLVLD